MIPSTTNLVDPPPRPDEQKDPAKRSQQLSLVGKIPHVPIKAEVDEQKASLCQIKTDKDDDDTHDGHDLSSPGHLPTRWR
jgi:hypothetical protein